MLIEKPTGTIRTAYDHNNDPYLFEATGAEAKRFIDILNADDEGRLLVLPCKVGETIYYLNPFDEIEKGRITMIQQKANGTLKFRVTTTSSHDATSDAFGKTVFLSREEAEAALKQEVESDA